MIKQLHDKTFNGLAPARVLIELPARFLIELAFGLSNKESFSGARQL